jgi:outer membrane protein TolC
VERGSSGGRLRTAMAALALAAFCAFPPWAISATMTLPDALGMAERNNASLQAVIARQDGARAAAVTARQRPNPELDVIAGPVRPRGPGGPDGHALGITFAQPLDYAGVRTVRAQVADLGSEGAEAAVRTLRRSLYARVKMQFY